MCGGILGSWVGFAALRGSSAAMRSWGVRGIPSHRRLSPFAACTSVATLNVAFDGLYFQHLLMNSRETPGYIRHPPQRQH